MAPSETSNGEVPACGQDIPTIGKLLAVTCPDKVAAVMAQEADIYASYPPITLLVDSGADFHVVGNKDLLLDMKGCTRRLIPATGEDMGVIGIGTLSLCLGKYIDINRQTRELDIQLPNVYYAPECAFNLLSLKKLNADNIHLDTRCKSLIFPAFRDMLMPDEKNPKPIGPGFDYDTWTLIQTNDGFGYPTFTFQYKAFDTPTLRGWLNNSKNGKRATTFWQ